MSLRVGVTGASGFIGRHVMAALASTGHHPVAVRRPFERDTLVSLFGTLDAVIHLAGVVSAVSDAEFVRGNVTATHAVADAARTTGVRLVHISSLAAAGPAPLSAPREEDDPPVPITAYGRTKLAGETVLRDTQGLRWTVLRPGVVYGPGDRALLPLFRYSKRGILPVVGNSAAAFTFVYIDDAVRAVLAAVERAATGDTIFVGHRIPVTARTLLEQVRTTLGASARLVRVPKGVTHLAALAGDVVGRVTRKPATINSRRFVELYSAGFVCRVDRMREHLGVVAEVDLGEGLARAAQWYGEQGWL